MKKLVAVAFVALLALPMMASAQQQTAARRVALPFAQVFKGAVNRGQAYYFHVKGANNEIVLASEAYRTKAAALNGVRSVLRTGVSQAVVKRNASGQFYFVLRGLNFRITAASETYKSRANVKRALLAIDRVLRVIVAKKVPIRGI